MLTICKIILTLLLTNSAPFVGNDFQLPTQGPVRSETHLLFPLSPSGRISLENTSGAVRITAWDRDEVKVDVVKTASRAEALDEAVVKIAAGPDSIKIRTKYVELDASDGVQPTDALTSVEYTLTVPRRAIIDRVKLIDSSLEISNLAGDVTVRSINGQIKAEGLTGNVDLATINGSVDTSLDRLIANQHVTLKSVNGSIDMGLPGYQRAELCLSSLQGEITADSMQITKSGSIGITRFVLLNSDSAGIDTGEPLIRIDNINGGISVHHLSGRGRLL